MSSSLAAMQNRWRSASCLATIAKSRWFNSAQIKQYSRWTIQDYLRYVDQTARSTGQFKCCPTYSISHAAKRELFDATAYYWWTWIYRKQPRTPSFEEPPRLFDHQLRCDHLRRAPRESRRCGR